MVKSCDSHLQNESVVINNAIPAFETAILQKSEDIFGKEQPSFSGMNSLSFQIETDSEVEKAF